MVTVSDPAPMERLLPGFLDVRRLMQGPWQAFERDIARLLVANGYEDVRIVAGSGDQGADVLGVLAGTVWAWQCKYTSFASPPISAIAEVINAAQYYGADRAVVATSRYPSNAFLGEKARFERLGYSIDVAGPDVLLALMERTPPFSPARPVLRDYQKGVVEKLQAALKMTGRGQVCLATGLGKTVVMAETVAVMLTRGEIRDARILVLAHTRELVDQLHRAFWRHLPSWVPTHQLSGTECPTFWDGITFATVQSAFSRSDTLPDFGLVIIDEAHHIGATTFLKVLDTIAPPMLVGATATPWRGDGFDLAAILGPPVAQLGIADGLRQGFLADVDYRLLADNVDWRLVQEVSEHHYSLSQLNRRLILPTRDEEAAQEIVSVFRDEGRRAGIVFSPTITHATYFAALLRQYGLRAESISSDMSPRERDRAMAMFRAGQYDLMTTVDLFNEGVDVPDVDLVAFMRVTHSRRIFVQQLGRGLRVSPWKDRVIVLDFVSDLRRVAEVIELDRAARGEAVEHLLLDDQLIRFRDVTAGGFLREWLLDQASLLLREDDPVLDLPRFQYPSPPLPGGIQ